MWRSSTVCDADYAAVGQEQLVQEATVLAKAAVGCLVLLSARHATGVTAKVVSLRSNFGDNRQLSISEFISVASKAGFWAQYVCRDWHWLRSATITSPVLLLLKNRNAVIAMPGGSNQEIRISDPLYNDGQVLTLPRRELERIWDGDTLTVAPRSVDGEVYRIGLDREPHAGSSKAATKRSSVKISLLLLSVILVSTVAVIVFNEKELSFDKVYRALSRSRFYEYSSSAPHRNVTPPVHLNESAAVGVAALSDTTRRNMASSTTTIAPGSIQPPATEVTSTVAAFPAAIVPPAISKATAAAGVPRQQSPATEAVLEPPAQEATTTAVATRSSPPHGAEPAALITPAPLDVRIAPAAPSMARVSTAMPTLATPSTPAISAAASDHLPAASTVANASRSEPTNGGDAVPPEHRSVGKLSREEASASRLRGDGLFGIGDVISARLFYERAAEAGDGKAALQLGETYDPAFLERAGIAGIRSDRAIARHWYQQASKLGVSEAQMLLNSMPDR